MLVYMRKILLFSTLLLVIPVPAHAAWVDVSTDGNTYHVSGGVIFHERFQGDRTSTAVCVRCYWTITRVCLSYDPADPGQCPDLMSSCPLSMQVAEVREAIADSRPPAESALWKFRGYTCIGKAGPLSFYETQQHLEGAWQSRVPDLQVSTLPPRSTLVNLPTRLVFESTDRLLVSRDVVKGMQVTLRATAHRLAVCATAPCSTVSSNLFRFGSVAHHALNVTATWSATFDALGLVDLPVTDHPIVQERQVDLAVYSFTRRLTQ